MPIPLLSFSPLATAPSLFFRPPVHCVDGFVAPEGEVGREQKKRGLPGPEAGQSLYLTTTALGHWPSGREKLLCDSFCLSPSFFPVPAAHGHLPLITVRKDIVKESIFMDHKCILQQMRRKVEGFILFY